MADIISLQELADAKLDAQSLERFINGDVDEEVLTRLSQQYPTIKKLLLEFQKYNGRAYKTYAEMDADKANLSSKTKVTVTNDATESNNGDWQWDGVAFTKSAYDPLTQAKGYTNESIEPLQTSLDSKLDKRSIEDEEILIAFEDAFHNIIATLRKDKSFKASDFVTDDDSLSGLRDDFINSLGNKTLSNLKTEDIAYAVEDAIKNLIFAYDKNAELHLNNIDRSVQKEIKRLTNLKDFSIKFALNAPSYTTTQLSRLAYIQNMAHSESNAVYDRYRLSTFRDDGSTTQRIPVVFKVDTNKAIVFFNRGISGFDGDFAGVDCYKCFVTWDANYRIKEITTPELFLSLQSVFAGASAKHATIGKLANGDLYLMMDIRDEPRGYTFYKQRYCTSNDKGVTWTAWRDVVFNNNFLTTEEQNNMSLVLGTGGKIITLPGGRLVTTVYTSVESVRRMAMIYSDDNGLTWTCSNTIGGLSEQANGIQMLEPNIARLQDGTLVSYIRNPNKTVKTKAISTDNGQTVTYVGDTNIQSAVCQSSVDTLSNGTVVLCTPTRTATRREFKTMLSIDDGENFDLLKHESLNLMEYGGYSSIENIDDQALLVAVEGITLNANINTRESIDIMMINLKEVYENGISY